MLAAPKREGGQHTLLGVLTGSGGTAFFVSQKEFIPSHIPDHVQIWSLKKIKNRFKTNDFLTAHCILRKRKALELVKTKNKRVTILFYPKIPMVAFSRSVFSMLRAFKEALG